MQRIMDKHTTGKLGEDLVCTELIRRGHRIIQRNYRKKCGEIDIISEKDGFVVFTEVKTRKLNSMVSGLEAVDERKRVRLVLTADRWLSENVVGLQPRYDIAVVQITRGDFPRAVSVDIYEDAFSADGIYTIN